MKFNKISFQIGLFAFVLLFTIVGCEKEDERPQNEIVAREKYLADNNITVAPTASGLYYIETLAGTGVAPDTNQYVKIVYEVFYLSGESFDGDTVDFAYAVGVVIPALDEALSYMKTGGKATIIVPSNLAFGAAGNDYVPPYTTLIYKIELLETYFPDEKEIELRNQYIIDNNITVAPTSTGLYYIETLEGTGDLPTASKIVEVKYKGFFLNGEVFDSGTLEFTMGAGQIIKGFEEGIGYMKKGGKATLIIPSDLAYGATGSQGVIPPYTTLVFEVELINIR
ncbi:MAG: FKBP-type peptidyl-prolyl cis-trans isomerase [Bacteroidales bacterium]|nr:FKBP-type peptidyl-prolyl cis-trans isomerase [Bacteroidales bacterium]